MLNSPSQVRAEMAPLYFVMLASIVIFPAFIFVVTMFLKRARLYQEAKKEMGKASSLQLKADLEMAKHLSWIRNGIAVYGVGLTMYFLIAFKPGLSETLTPLFGATCLIYFVFTVFGYFKVLGLREGEA